MFSRRRPRCRTGGRCTAREPSKIIGVKVAIVVIVVIVIGPVIISVIHLRITCIIVCISVRAMANQTRFGEKKKYLSVRTNGVNKSRDSSNSSPTSNNINNNRNNNNTHYNSIHSNADVMVCTQRYVMVYVPQCYVMLCKTMLMSWSAYLSVRMASSVFGPLYSPAIEVCLQTNT